MFPLKFLSSLVFFQMTLLLFVHFFFNGTFYMNLPNISTSLQNTTKNFIIFQSVIVPIW